MDSSEASEGYADDEIGEDDESNSNHFNEGYGGAAPEQLVMAESCLTLYQIGNDVEYTEEEECLDELDITGDDAVDLVCVALDRSYDDVEPEGWASVHALQILRHLEHLPEIIEELVELLATDDLWLSQGFMRLAIAYGDIALPPLEKYLKDKRSPIKGLCACVEALRRLGVAHPALLPKCIELTVGKLSRSKDKRLNTTIIGELKKMHGFKDIEIDEATTKDFLPSIKPSPKTLKVIASCYRKHLCDPSVVGGYIDFLEAAVLPVDPANKAVLDMDANCWPTMFRNEEGETQKKKMTKKEMNEYHAKRIEELREHWQYLHRMRRAKSLEGVATTVIVLLIFYGLYAYFNHHFGPLANINRAAAAAHSARADL